MKRKNYLSVFRKLENYAFGAAALKEEIERHKKEDKTPWSPSKAIGIRALYVYAIGATLMLIIGVMLLRGAQNIMSLFSKKRKR